MSPFADFDGQTWQLRDLLGQTYYERNGSDPKSRELYLDMSPWK